VRLREWLRRRQRQAQARPSSPGGGSTSPIDDYASSTALHTAVLNTLATDTARHAPPEASSPPYGPHHTPHGSGAGHTDHSGSHSHADHSDAGSSSSHDTGSSSSHDSGSSSTGGGYDSGGSSGGFDSGSSSSW
jgi:hypothetical protein